MWVRVRLGAFPRRHPQPGPNPNPSPNPDPNRNPSPSPNPSPSRNPNPNPNLRQALLNGWAHEKSFFIPAAIYTALQVLTALTLRDFWLDDILPFSCCPMFMLPRNPFDEWPKLWTMSTAPLTGSTRACGAMEPLYWTPASPIFDMPLSEARKLPQKVLWFGSTLHCPVEVPRYGARACPAACPPALHPHPLPFTSHLSLSPSPAPTPSPSPSHFTLILTLTQLPAP